MNKEKENSNTLSQNATLVRLNTKHPSGVKSDKYLKDNLAIDQEALKESLHVAKYIFGKDTNKYFRRIINQFRNNVYYSLTVPGMIIQVIMKLARFLVVGDYVPIVNLIRSWIELIRQK